MQIGLAAGAVVALGVGAGYRDRAGRWSAGAGGERRVARELRRLERRSWVAWHDVMKPRGGNVDHLVAGPGGLFTIETKLNRFDAKALAQARSHAAWATKATGVQTRPVLCVARSEMKPKTYAGVACTGGFAPGALAA